MTIVSSCVPPEKFFEMKKAQCKETVEAYRKFLTRQEGVHRYLKLAEVRRGEPFVLWSLLAVTNNQLVAESLITHVCIPSYEGK